MASHGFRMRMGYNIGYCEEGWKELGKAKTHARHELHSQLCTVVVHGDDARGFLV